jgi:hypothetical protein
MLDGVELPRELVDAWAAVTDADDALAALAGMPEVRDALARWEAGLARDALATGASWTTIGHALGTSRQAAWERLRPGIAAAIEADRRHLEEQRARTAKRRRRTHDRG